MTAQTTPIFDVELREIDQASAPSSPWVVRGKPAIAEAVRRYAERASRSSYAMRSRQGIALLELQGGKVARQLTFQARDA